MKTFFFLCIALFGAAVSGQVRAEDECLSEYLSTGSILHSDIADYIKYSKHCVIAREDGVLTLVVLGADTPISVEARRGGRVVGSNVQSQGGQKVPVTREFSIDVKRGDRIDIRVDSLVRGSERHGNYRLLVSSDRLDDPQLFGMSKVMNFNTMSFRYSPPDDLMKPISLSKSKMISTYFPGVGNYPHLRFAVEGVDTSKLVVSTIQLSNGQQQMVAVRDGYYHIPATDPEGMILSIGNTSTQSINFTLKFREKP